MKILRACFSINCLFFTSKFIINSVSACSSCSTYNRKYYTMANSPSTSDSKAKTTCDGPPFCKRFPQTEGDAGKRNDVILCSDGHGVQPVRQVVYFGGDVQDYSENMLAHRDNKRYEEWNLEKTGKLLCEKFPASHVYVIKPAVMQLKTFSSYENFVLTDQTCCPTHSKGQGSWKHLKKLLQNAMVEHCRQNEQDSCDHKDFLDDPVVLIGFSKGCVVLNQLLYDLEDALQDEDTGSFVKQISDMYWLDGGHNGGCNTWVTNPEVLNALTKTNIKVHSHVTPYQMKDDMRKWIGQEQKKFIKILQKFNIPLTNTMHFGGEERSLDFHFKVLTVFVD